MQKYDIFVSYRRDSYESANLIATRLRAAGYSVFFDLESMRSGLFNEQLYKVIEECRDVLAVLPPSALDRCADKNDWVRKELVHAMEQDKNIIPIMLNGFQWPEIMPEGMEKLCLYQSVASSRDFFDLSMERLESYLHSRKHVGRRKMAVKVAVTLTTVLLLCIIFLSVCRYMAKPVCRQITEHTTARIGEVELLMEDNLSMAEMWKSYAPEKREDMLKLLASVVKNMDYLRSTSGRHPLELTGWQIFLAGRYWAEAAEVEFFDGYVDSFYDDMRTNIQNMTDAISSSEPLLPSVHNAYACNMEIFTHLANALYYSYLQMINEFPAESQEIYRNIARKFSNMPTTGLGLNSKEYDMLIERENNFVERLLAGQKKTVKNMKDDVYLAEGKRDSLYRKVVEDYRAIIGRNRISPEDSLVQNWARVCMVASLLDTAVQDATEDDTNPIGPQIVWKDMERTLSDYVEVYPDSKPYITAVRALYREVMENRRKCSGILISAFAPSYSPVFYRLGDIIVSWNDIDVSSIEDLKAAYRKGGNGKLKLLRLENNGFIEISADIPGEEDYVGFSNIRFYD